MTIALATAVTALAAPPKADAAKTDATKAEAPKSAVYEKTVASVKRIWDEAPHSAFTDIIRFGGGFYCTFREGSGHIPGKDGVVRILYSADGDAWKSHDVLTEEGVDLRDPKICATPDGRLMINMGASTYRDGKRLKVESRVSFSDSDGTHFSKPIKVIFPQSMLTGYDWLWRITWHKGVAWAAVQQFPVDKPRSLQVVNSKDGVTYDQVATLDVPVPSETTLRFLPDDTMLAMIRVSQKGETGRVGEAKPPYKNWELRKATTSFSGPNFVQLSSGAWLAGCRGSAKGGATTALYWLNPNTATAEPLLTLPSGGDTSYPGFAVDEKNNRVLVSYYSSHEGKTSIYLATLRLDELLKHKP